MKFKLIINKEKDREVVATVHDRSTLTDEIEDARKKLASVCRCTFDAPVILAVCYDCTLDWMISLQ